MKQYIEKKCRVFSLYPTFHNSQPFRVFFIVPLHPLNAILCVVIVAYMFLVAGCPTAPPQLLSLHRYHSQSVSYVKNCELSL